MLINISMHWTINKLAKKYNGISEEVDGIYIDSANNKESFVSRSYAILLVSHNSQSIEEEKIKGILGNLYDKRKGLENQILPTWSAKIGKKLWDIGRNQVVAERCRGFRVDQDFRQNVENIKDDFLRNNIIGITKKFEQDIGLRELPALASSHYR